MGVPFPPKARLKRLIRAAILQAPEQMSTLLESERFEEGAACIRRLSDRAYLQEALAQTTETEAFLLADQLERGLRRIGDVPMEPAAAIVGPEEVWMNQSPLDVTLEIATLNLEEDWRAEWVGDGYPSEDSRQFFLTLASGSVDAVVSVRVMGRCRGERCILPDRLDIKVRTACTKRSDPPGDSS